jgi:hypothetical protein
MWTGVAGDKFRVADDGPLAGRAAVGPRRAPRPPPERSLEGAGVLATVNSLEVGRLKEALARGSFFEKFQYRR